MSSPGQKMQSYLDRANELDATPLKIVAYYARYYVVQKLMNLRTQKELPESDMPLLISLLDKLEEMKAADASIMADGKLDQQRVSDFALSVFKKADDADRSGVCTKQTAMQYFYSVKFFDVLEVFDETGAFELEKQFEDKRKYAKYKAHYIRECLKQGLEPVPGPPGGETEQEIEAMFEEEQKKQEVAMAAGAAPAPAGADTSAGTSADTSVGGSLAPPPAMFSLEQAQLAAGVSAGSMPAGASSAPPPAPAAAVAAPSPSATASAPPPESPPMQVQGVPVMPQQQAFAQPTPQSQAFAQPTPQNQAFAQPTPQNQAFAQPAPQQQAFAQPPVPVAVQATRTSGATPGAVGGMAPPTAGMSAYERKQKCRDLVKTALQCLDFDDFEGAKKILGDAINSL